MRRTVALLLVVLLASPVAWAKSKEEERLGDCARILGEVLNIPDGIPQDLLDRARTRIHDAAESDGLYEGSRGA